MPVDAFGPFLEGRADLRLLLVNDGSTDGTGALLESAAERHPGRVEVLNLPHNQGKAEAVRQGVLRALRDPGVTMVGFLDADLATPLSAIPSLAQVLRDRPHIDAVLGSRVKLLGREIERSALRHYLGRVFATVASLVLNLPVYDTQCGAKMFRANQAIREVFEEPFGSRWVFDVEILARMLQRNGSARAVYELPLETWKDVPGSKVRPIDFARAIGEAAKIYRRYRLPRRHQRWFDVLTAPFFRYSGAGALGTLLHYAILTVAVEGLGRSPVFGAVAGATGGALLNYWFNYHFTFVSNHSHRRTLPRFMLVAVAGIGLNAWIVDVMTEAGFHYLLGQLLATLAVLLLGFVINRAWTFSKRG